MKKVIIVPPGSLQFGIFHQDGENVLYVESAESVLNEKTCSCNPCTREEGTCPKQQGVNR